MDLRDVESALGQVHTGNAGASRDFLDVLASYVVRDQLSGDSATQALVSTERSPEQRRVIGSFLIRFIARDGVMQSDTISRRHILALLDHLYAEDLYKSLHIKANDPGHEKAAALADAPAKLEEQIVAHCESLLDLQQLRRAQQRLMRDLKSPIAVALLHPVANQALRDERVTLLFTSAADYVNDEGTAKASSFHDADAAMGTYLSDLDKDRNPYATHLLSPVAHKLREAVAKDFNSGPYSRPAAVDLAPVQKRYPLAQPGSTFDLVLALSNSGEGTARDVSVGIIQDSGCVQILDRTRDLPVLDPGSIEIAVPCRVVEPEDLLILQAELAWTDFDGQRQRIYRELEFESQNPDIDWSALENSEPYSLEPVSSTERLVGREAILQRMISKLTSTNMGSFWLWGQRRVGKTSIARTLDAILQQPGYDNYRFVFVEAGDFVDPDPEVTICNLGRLLCEEVREFDSRLSDLEIPEFGQSLSPIRGFLQSALRRAPDLRVVFAIDEFDRLPPDIYAKGSVGQSFFLTLRSIGAKAAFGFVLVGGENMSVILNNHGQELNKFEVAEVDYFDWATQLDDFRNLLVAPVAGSIVFDDAAITRFHNWTAGNPYFTNLVAAELFQTLVARRDSYVIARDVDDAAAATISRAGSNSFQHFWDDGITEPGATGEAVSLQRRQVLVALGHTLRSQDDPGRDEIARRAIAEGLSESACIETLADFERRRVLLRDGDAYRPKVRLLEEWLTDKGTSQILTTLPERTAIQQRELEEAEQRVGAAEIVDLAKDLGTYRGREITTDHIRAWLDQFGPPREQRLMFTLLEHLDFYSADRVRTLLGEAHGIASRGTIRRLDIESVKRSDFLVTFVDGPGKSGAKMAQLYADENRIYRDNVVSVDKLPSLLTELAGRIQVVVLVDDFIGTGRALEDYLTTSADEIRAIERSGARGYLFALAGFNNGLKRVDRTVESLGLGIESHLCNPLAEADRCFSASSRIFSNETERASAEKVARARGATLVHNNPLGFGNTQSAVVFWETVPNNSLPVLWARSSGFDPLFPRDR